MCCEVIIGPFNLMRFSFFQTIEPPRVSEELASLAHCPIYVNRFFHGLTNQDEQRRTGFSWTHGLASRVRFETGTPILTHNLTYWQCSIKGGTLLAALLALERGLACSTGGGTHHAGPDYGSGYCLINDLAVAARFLTNLGTQQGQSMQVLIVDLDVHQVIIRTFTVLFFCCAKYCYTV